MHRQDYPRRNAASGLFKLLFTGIGAVLLVLAVAACTWQELQPGSDKARHLYIVGDLVHVSDKQIAETAQPYLGSGFFEVEIESIQDAVAALPWVASVSVHRRWPDAVVVRVREHRAVARWGDDRLLAEDGAVFAPLTESIPSGLVALDGPDDSGAKVWKQYNALQLELARTEYRLARLALGVRGAWQAELDSGLTVRLGRDEMQPRLQRFLNHLSPELENRLEDADYVDLRYTDGFAVGAQSAHEPQEQHDGQGESNGKKG